MHREAGYDGEYGVIRLFAPDEIRGRSVVAPLFAPEDRPSELPRAALTSPALLSQPPPDLTGEEGEDTESIFVRPPPGGGEEDRERGGQGE